MANKKFSEFVLKTSTSDVSHIVGYNGAENVQITPANFVTGGGTGVFLPLAGGLMVGNTTHNDNVKSIYGTSNDGLEIYHDGTNSYVSDTGTGNLRIRATDFRLESQSLIHNFLIATETAGVQLFFNDIEKFKTTNTGISVTGDGVFTGDLTATGGDYTSNGINILSNSVNSQTLRIGDTLLASEITNVKIRTNGIDSLQVNSLGNTILGGNIDASNGTFVGNVRIEADSAALSLISSDTGASLINFGDTSDSNIGRIYYDHQNNFMQFKTNDAEKMRLDSSGNLGVGTTSSDALLHISQASSNAQLIVERTGSATGKYQIYTNTNNLYFNNLASSSIPLTILDNGRIGMGNVDPDVNLEISGDGASYPKLKLSNPSQTGRYLQIGMIDGTNYCIEANGGSTFLTFKTEATERMRIDSTGKVGINEDSPAAKLVVNQDSLVDTEGIFVQSGSSPADGGVAIFKSASKIGTISALGGASSLSFMTDGGSEKMRITSGGNLLIGKTADNDNTVGTRINAIGLISVTRSGNASAIFDRTTSNGNLVLFRRGGTQVGSISVNTTSTTYNTSSDYRLKEDLQDFKGLDLVSKIPVYDYKWKADDSRSYGVMAHELEEVLPQAVTGDKDAEEMQSVDYSKIVPLLVKSIQELSAKLEALECQCEKK